MLNTLSKTKTKGVRESFYKKLEHGLGAKNGNRRRGKAI